MEHSFDVNIAKEYGIPASILLKNIYFWVEKNRANETNFYDGNYWTYNSKKAYSDLFPYMNARQIDYALKKLIDDGLVITGNYNKMSYDRTLWYAVTKKGYSILQNCNMDNTKFVDGKANNDEPIPDTKPVINSNIIKDIVSYLNDKLETKYSYKTKKTQDCINARLNENNYTLDDFKTVIDKKYNDWRNTEFIKYLRPETLFGTKFESYLNEIKPVATGKEAPKREYSKEKLDSLFDDVFEVKILKEQK